LYIKSDLKIKNFNIKNLLLFILLLLYIEIYVLFQLSIVRNQLLRMYGISKLHNLVTLNLANNGILTIEGIKDMINLQTLCLAGNNIKVKHKTIIFDVIIL